MLGSNVVAFSKALIVNFRARMHKTNWRTTGKTCSPNSSALNGSFSSFDNFVKRETGVSIRSEYALTMVMVKELCMVEKNETSH